MKFGFEKPDRYKSLEEDSIAKQLLWHSQNIADLAGYRTPEMASNIIRTPEWVDQDGLVNMLEALKFDATDDSDQPKAVQYKLAQWQPGKKYDSTTYLWKTNLGGVYQLYDNGYSPLPDYMGRKKDSLLASLNAFNKDEALRRQYEPWAIDKENTATGVEQVNAAFWAIVATSHDIHSRVIKQSLAQRILRRGPAISAERVREEFPDDKSAVQFLRDSDTFTK